MSKKSLKSNRRKVIAGLSTASIISLSGCIGPFSSNDDDSSDEDSTGSGENGNGGEDDSGGSSIGNGEDTEESVFDDIDTGLPSYASWITGGGVTSSIFTVNVSQLADEFDELELDPEDGSVEWFDSVESTAVELPTTGGMIGFNSVASISSEYPFLSFIDDQIGYLTFEPDVPVMRVDHIMYSFENQLVILYGDVNPMGIDEHVNDYSEIEQSVGHFIFEGDESNGLFAYDGDKMVFTIEDRGNESRYDRLIEQLEQFRDENDITDQDTEDILSGLGDGVFNCVLGDDGVNSFELEEDLTEVLGEDVNGISGAGFSISSFDGSGDIETRSVLMFEDSNSMITEEEATALFGTDSVESRYYSSDRYTHVTSSWDNPNNS